MMAYFQTVCSRNPGLALSATVTLTFYFTWQTSQNWSD
jgi:hypothetical protein